MKAKKAPKARYSAAYKKAVEEIAREKVLELKVMVKGTMDAIAAKAAARKKLDEELALLHKDIEDLKRGRIEKIKARQEKEPAYGSKIDAAKIAQSIVPVLSGYTVTNTTAGLPTNVALDNGQWSTWVNSATTATAQ